MQDRIIFMGTPEFAIPALQALAERVSAESLLVVTQPDRKAGRGRKFHPPPVKVEAERLDLDVLQVETMKDQRVRQTLEGFAPELIIVAAFGRILPKWVLQLPARGCVNLHASLLPRFRGASPIAAAIACGDDISGVSLMEMEAGLDTGAVYAESRVPIHGSDTTESLTGRLANSAGELVSSHLEPLLNGELTPVPQRGAIIETRKIVKAHGMVDWAVHSQQIDQHVRAMWPWPRAWTTTQDGLRVQIHEVDLVDAGVDTPPGTIVGSDDDGPLVATGGGAVKLHMVQLPGKAAQKAGELHQHPAFAVGSQFSSEDLAGIEPWIVPAGDV